MYHADQMRRAEPTDYLLVPRLDERTEGRVDACGIMLKVFLSF